MSYSPTSADTRELYQELTGFSETRLVTPIDKNAKDLHHGLAVKDEAANIIQKSWKAFRMAKTYKWLKHMLFKTERMLTKEVLKRLSPNEGFLLTDPALKVNVRFRLGGDSFPPKILYKIYTSGMNVHYFSGQDTIRAGSKAAEDSFGVMGSRCFHEKILLADLQKENYKVSRAYEVTDKMEFIQYMNTLDKKPPHLGGRSNDWRELKVTQTMLQGVILEGKTEHYPPSEISRRGFPSRRTINRPSPISRKENGVKTSKNADVIEVDDEFGMLFDWVTHLDDNDLGDFHEVQVKA